MRSERRREKLLDQLEKERYWAHVALYDYPGKRSFWAFVGFYRYAIFQICWVVWAAFWTGIGIGTQSWFTAALNGVLTPVILLLTLFMWHKKVVLMGRVHLRNLQDIGRWMRHHGIDQDEPPSWFH